MRENKPEYPEAVLLTSSTSVVCEGAASYGLLDPRPVIRVQEGILVNFLSVALVEREKWLNSR